MFVRFLLIDYVCNTTLVWYFKDQSLKTKFAIYLYFLNTFVLCLFSPTKMSADTYREGTRGIGRHRVEPV